MKKILSYIMYFLGTLVILFTAGGSDVGMSFGKVFVGIALSIVLFALGEWTRRTRTNE